MDITDTQSEVTEAIQSDIPHDLLQGVMGVDFATISAWADGSAEWTAQQAKRFRAAFRWIYGAGDQYRPGDEAECHRRAKAAR